MRQPLLDAGILLTNRAHGTRCLHCSLPVGRGCRCSVLPDDRRRPNTDAVPSLGLLTPALAGTTWTRGIC